MTNKINTTNPTNQESEILNKSSTVNNNIPKRVKIKILSDETLFTYKYIKNILKRIRGIIYQCPPKKVLRSPACPNIYANNSILSISY